MASVTEVTVGAEGTRPVDPRVPAGAGLTKRTRWRALALAGLLSQVLACGGVTAARSDAGDAERPAKDGGGVMADTGTGRPETGVQRDSGASCGQPTHTVYSCPVGSTDGGVCRRYGGSGDTAPADAGFPLGCTVTLPQCDTAFGSPQTCDCQEFPGGDAGPTWICPL